MARPEVEIALILELGKALNAYGTPARRLENTLLRVAVKLSMKIQVFATVTCLIVSFGPLTHLQTALARVEPRDLDLGKLSRLDGIVEAFMHGEFDSHELHERILNLRAELPPPRHLRSVLVRAVGAGSWGFLLGGGLYEAAAATVAGGLVACLSVATQRWGRLNHEFVALAAALVGASVVGCAALFGPISPQVANLAALLPLLPGLTLVIASEELASKDLLAGTSRLVSAAMVFVQLMFGVALGSQLARLLDESLRSHPHRALPFLLQCVLLLPAMLALTFQLKIGRRDLPWALAAGVIGFFSSRFGTSLVGIELGAFIGALSVGVFGNAVARWLHRPALLTIVPGMFVLLPGSLGFQSVSALWTEQPLEGVRSAFSVAVIAVALATGLLVSASALPPRRAL
ncbi:MAG: threonine/serine exporter family protein [Myxococcales bacterium]